MLKPTKIMNYGGLSLAEGANYEVVMPADYLHILNCICIYRVDKTYKCYNRGDTWRAAATRLTADMYSQVLDNFWNKPDYKRPYYYIHNVNTINDKWKNDNPSYDDLPQAEGNTGHMPNESRGNINYATIPTAVYENDGNYKGRGIDSPNVEQNATAFDTDNTHYHGNIENTSLPLGKDGVGVNIYQGEDYKNSIDLTFGNTTAEGSLREKGAYIRYGNRSEVRIEIRYGTDDSVFKLTDVYVDYIKAPQHIRLTQYQIDRTEDVSQLLEYPDYVCQEIINELVHLVMENISDQRLQTHPVVTQSIANPAQAQTPDAAQGRAAQ